MKKRIVGIDVARALAIIGMIIVNFKIVFGSGNSNWLSLLAGVFDGKAAATFVVLAGVGLALMTKSSLKKKDDITLKKVRKKIIKRALFLFIIGVSYIPIWPADILHFYGVYMILTILLLTSSDRTILLSGISFILIFPILLLVFDYELNWDFNTLEYHNFWTLKGFLRNLFFNGFHPVIPWTSFMLFGYWLGKQNLHNTAFVKKIFGISSIVFILLQLCSYFLIALILESNQDEFNELVDLLGTNPMPPLPIYMFNGIAISFAVISGCILIARRFQNNVIIEALNKTGQLALTFYVAHVIIGMGVVEIFNPNKLGKYTIEFSIIYALVFSLGCIIFAVIWKKYFEAGPLEGIMRKITND